MVTHFGDIGFNLYAHDSYLVLRGAPDASDGFAGHAFVLPEFSHDRLPFGAWIKDNIRPEMVALSSRDIGVITKAVCTGLGMGFMGDAEAQKRGNLRPVLPANTDWKVTCWLVTHVDLHRTEKVQAMLSCIKALSLRKVRPCADGPKRAPQEECVSWRLRRHHERPKAQLSDDDIHNSLFHTIHSFEDHGDGPSVVVRQPAKNPIPPIARMAVDIEL